MLTSAEMLLSSSQQLLESLIQIYLYKIVTSHICNRLHLYGHLHSQYRIMLPIVAIEVNALCQLDIIGVIPVVQALCLQMSYHVNICNSHKLFNIQKHYNKSEMP